MPRQRPRNQVIRIGVSSCLLGQEVRYDGGHAYEPFVAETLSGPFELVPICPEVELGMGTPRETVRLVGQIDTPRMVGTHSLQDWTAAMNRWSNCRVRQSDAADFCGYIFKRNSPSCGVFKVKIYPNKGRVRRQGRGLFAAEFTRRFPLVPVEEEVRLQDPRVREHFIVRVFALQRLRRIFAGRWRRDDIMAFHEREAALLQAHDPQGLKKLNDLLNSTRATFGIRFQSAFMAILARPATTARHVRVLRYFVGLLGNHISVRERKLIADRIDDFRLGQVPLLVPQAIVQYSGARHGLATLQTSSYLNPDPRELALRNHA